MLVGEAHIPVYQRVYDQWGTQVFTNIARSEQSHADAVLAVLVAKGIEDLVLDDAVGVFQDNGLAGIYDALIAQGSTSLVDALMVGAIIEDMDIYDLDAVASHTAEPLVLDLYDTLRCGSENHMRAFARQLDMQGAVYTAQYISDAEYEKILAAQPRACQ